jgi:hypothetical protein
MTVVKVVEDIAFGAHWPCQSIGRGLCAKVQTGGSPRASREPLVASADEPSVGPEKDRHFSQGGARAARSDTVQAALAMKRLGPSTCLPLIVPSPADPAPCPVFAALSYL